MTLWFLLLFQFKGPFKGLPVAFGFYYILFALRGPKALGICGASSSLKLLDVPGILGLWYAGEPSWQQPFSVQTCA